MTCGEVRDRILAADLSVLRGESDAAIKEHLASCAGCSAAASRVLSSTNVLAAALRGRAQIPQIRPTRQRRVGVVWIPMAIAAEIIMVAVLMHRGAPVLPHMAPANQSVMRGGEAVPVASAPTTRSLVRLPEPSPSVSRAPDHQVAVAAPVSIAALADDTSVSDLRVTVDDTHRAAVIATSNPKVTVVWLYRGDSL